MPKVSIIVPVWNVEKTIEKTIQSILKQKMKEIEIILVNDGSTDNSEKILKKYKEQYQNKIKVVNKTNGGLSSARNEGVKIANGEYIAFLDGGDYINENLLAELENYINQKIDLIKFKMTLVDSKGNKIKKIEGPIFEKCCGEEAFLKLFGKDNYLEVACVYLYRKEFFKQNHFKYNENNYHQNYGGAYHEDFGLTPLILLKAKTVVSVENYGYYYIQDENSITRNDNYDKQIDKANDLLIHYDTMIEFLKKNDISPKAQEQIKAYYTNIIILKLRDLKKEEQEKYKEEIHKRNMIKNIKVNNVKQLIKKILLKTNINLFLKFK